MTPRVAFDSCCNAASSLSLLFTCCLLLLLFADVPDGFSCCCHYHCCFAGVCLSLLVATFPFPVQFPLHIRTFLIVFCPCYVLGEEWLKGSLLCLLLSFTLFWMSFALGCLLLLFWSHPQFVRNGGRWLSVHPWKPFLGILGSHFVVIGVYKWLISGLLVVY